MECGVVVLCHILVGLDEYVGQLDKQSGERQQNDCRDEVEDRLEVRDVAAGAHLIPQLRKCAARF